MTKDLYDQPLMFQAFLKASQYIVRITAQQDIWDHLGKLVTAHFPAGWTAFAQRDSRGDISIRNCSLSSSDMDTRLLTDDVRTAVADVLDSGFLTTKILSVPRPSATVFLPVSGEVQPAKVMLIGHGDAESIPKNLLDIYLSIVGLAGATSERLENERELDRHRMHLEEMVKEATAELGQEKRRNELILHSVREGICGINLNGRIIFVNPFGAEMIGWAPSDIIGRDAHSTFHNVRPDGSPYRMEECSAHSTLREGIAKFTSDEVFIRKDGTRFPVEFATAPIVENGSVIGAVMAFRDISERKIAEELTKRQSVELERKAKELAMSNQDLEQFAYVASHDLQEPLRAVTGFLGLLRAEYGEKLDADGIEYIIRASDGAERMSRLISDLLAYSRIESRGRKPTPIDPNDALESALVNLRSSLDEVGVKISHDPLPLVLADEMQIGQLFQNLIGNAVKFRHKTRPCEIHVGASQEGAWQTLSVKDNGIGIPQEQFERIFIIFQRLYTRDEYPGTGIGLAICKRIVERQGGRIWVESSVGEGSTFYLTLPAVSPSR